MENEKNSFVFYRSYANAASRMSDQQRLQFFDSLIAYGLDRKEIKSSGDALIDMAFDFVIPLLDANYKNYENGKKGAKYGKLGGRPRKNPDETPKKPLKNPDETRNVNDNANDNVNDNANDNVNVNEKNIEPSAHEPTKEELLAEGWEGKVLEE